MAGRADARPVTAVGRMFSLAGRAESVIACLEAHQEMTGIGERSGGLLAQSQLLVQEVVNDLMAKQRVVLIIIRAVLIILNNIEQCV